MAEQPRARIVVVSNSERLVRAAAHILRSAEHDVVELGSAADARTWFRIHRADLAVIDLNLQDAARAPEATDLIRSLKNDAPRGSTHVLVLARARGDMEVLTLFERGRLSNFLAVGADEQIEPVELTATVAKILTKEIFGLDKYLAQGTEEHLIRVRRSQQKAEVVDAVEAFARKVGCHPQVAQGIATAADELVTNAIYNAPVDAAGRPRYAHYARSVPVELGETEEVCVRFGFDGRRLGLSTRDPFGSLPPDRVLEYLTKCFAKGEDQVDSKQGGAGLGLYYVFKNMHHFVVNIAPGKSTEAIGLLEVTGRYRDHAAKAKSFNVFVA